MQRDYTPITSDYIGARYAVIGPPGTGKTSYLKRQIERAAHRFGANEVAAVSMTRAAASELRGRVESVPERAVGTLHAMCFRELGAPAIAETKIDEWNTAHPHLSVAVKGETASLEHDAGEVEQGPRKGAGQELYEGMNLRRHRREPIAGTRYEGFAAKWREWLADTGYVDFTGLIERGLDDLPTAPGEPLCLFGDETQDMSRLEMALLLKWGRRANGAFVTVGDDAQCIYRWRGADPRAFLEAGERIVLATSYRVPEAVHRQATSWAGHLLDGVDYAPRGARGSVEHSDECIAAAADVIEAELARTDGTVLFQAQCAYMLQPVIAELRDRGHIWWNPNRLTNGAWNPLGTASADGSRVRTLDRYLAWRRGCDGWPTPEQCRLWMPMLSASCLKRGAKKRIERATTDADIYELWADDETMIASMKGDPEWLIEHVTASWRDRLRYLVAAERRHDLSRDPRLLVGTIHSFKGAEADTVITSPQLSPQAWQAWNDDGEDQDDVRRLFYVAMTRARERLVLLSPWRGRNIAWD